MLSGLESAMEDIGSMRLETVSGIRKQVIDNLHKAEGDDSILLHMPMDLRTELPRGSRSSSPQQRRRILPKDRATQLRHGDFRRGPESWRFQRLGCGGGLLGSCRRVMVGTSCRSDGVFACWALNI
jgi:hypothetical protein